MGARQTAFGPRQPPVTVEEGKAGVVSGAGGEIAETGSGLR